MSAREQMAAETGDLYHAHWTPEYKAWVKRQADRQWDIISKRYDALRKPFDATADEFETVMSSKDAYDAACWSIDQ